MNNKGKFTKLLVASSLVAFAFSAVAAQAAEPTPAASSKGTGSIVSVSVGGAKTTGGDAFSIPVGVTSGDTPVAVPMKTSINKWNWAGSIDYTYVFSKSGLGVKAGLDYAGQDFTLDGTASVANNAGTAGTTVTFNKDDNAVILKNTSLVVGLAFTNAARSNAKMVYEVAAGISYTFVSASLDNLYTSKVMQANSNLKSPSITANNSVGFFADLGIGMKFSQSAGVMLYGAFNSYSPEMSMTWMGTTDNTTNGDSKTYSSVATKYKSYVMTFGAKFFFKF